MDYRDPTPMSYSAREQTATVDDGLRSYMLGVYNYMTSALCLTGLAAYFASNWAPLSDALYNTEGLRPHMTGLGWLVLFAPLVMVFFMNKAVNRLSLAGAQTYFFVYAALIGLSLAPIFFVYTNASIVRVFLITAIVFGSMSMWGYATKRDLTAMGSFMYMGVIGIILASLVNMFFQSTAMQFALSVLGVVIFTGLTAYNTQKLKQIYYQTAGSAELASRYAIMGALSLYLDFVNLFIYMMQLMGERR